ncbi:MAG: helix-turn-helix transcriptional regulator [Cytophagales bacterium]|nr:helix-turn-helix transcriptional regulator [Cytophagales bacterium]
MKHTLVLHPELAPTPADHAWSLARQGLAHLRPFGSQFSLAYHTASQALFGLSPSMGRVLELSPENFTHLDELLARVHPNDLPFFQKAWQKTEQGLCAAQLADLIPCEPLFQFDIRMQHRRGYYLRLLWQLGLLPGSTAQDVFAFALVSDISLLQSSPYLHWHFVGPAAPHGLDAEPLSSFGLRVSNRELEVLQLLANGRDNEQIAKTLHISRLTVSQHRKNVLARYPTMSIYQLIKELVQAGLIS